tara:strand:- start:288 stop:737 length:450 start_codon:yes stop_codon:yes gene_type:complete
MVKDEIFINLETPIKCHHKGQLEEFGELVISAPNATVLRSHLEIKDCFLRAINKSQITEDKTSSKENNSSSDSEMSSKHISTFLSMQGEKMADMFDELKKILITKNMCYLYKDEKKEQMVSSIFESLKLNDLDNCFGEYVNNFILASMK